MFAKPSESELNAEYNIIKNGMITATGDKSADNIIYAFKKSKSSIKIMKFMSIAMIILGIPTPTYRCWILDTSCGHLLPNENKITNEKV